MHFCKFNNCFAKFLNIVKNSNNKNLTYTNTFRYDNSEKCNCIKNFLEKNKNNFYIEIHECSNHKTQFFSKNEYILQIRKI
jgi:hypothetical protein